MTDEMIMFFFRAKKGTKHAVFQLSEEEHVTPLDMASRLLAIQEAEISGLKAVISKTRRAIKISNTEYDRVQKEIDDIKKYFFKSMDREMVDAGVDLVLKYERFRNSLLKEDRKDVEKNKDERH